MHVILDPDQAAGHGRGDLSRGRRAEGMNVEARWLELFDELTALEQERHPLAVAATRAGVLEELAVTQLDAARAAYDAATTACRSTAATARSAERALRRH